MGTDLPYRLRCWDGSEAGPADARAMIVLRSRRALRTFLWEPNELGLARAYIAGDLDIEGDIYAVLDSPELMQQLSSNEGLRLTLFQKVRALPTLALLGAIGPRPPLPAEEVVRPRRVGRLRHSPQTDATAISHHYDVGNDFYALVLGPSMVYSCAYWVQAPSTNFGLDEAQREKLDLVCRKLALRPGQRLLDVGCGWGGLAMHAAREYGVRVVGVTLSRAQSEWAQKAIAEAGLGQLAEVRHLDYRDVKETDFDAVSSIGLTEHIG